MPCQPRRSSAPGADLCACHGSAAGGEFVSLLDPPEELRSAAQGCRRLGVFPVLVGDPAMRDAMLLSPIILYDFPVIAPESQGDFFDSSEIDEMLTLRVLTLTEEEKREVRQGDPASRRILERAEPSSQQDLLRLHGVLRQGGAAVELKTGDRVRLHPQRQADIFDIALAGKLATITSMEKRWEDEIYVAVVVDDDPGADLGEQRQIGHRFFFRANEVERVECGATVATSGSGSKRGRSHRLAAYVHCWRRNA